MRLLRISNFPEKYSSQIYAPSKFSQEDSYAKSLDNYFKQFISIGDAITYELNKLGSYEAVEVVMNHRLLQQKWAEENNFKYSENWQIDILKQQIQAFKPEIIFVNSTLIDYKLFQFLTEGINIKLSLSWDGYPYTSAEKNKGFGVVLTCVNSICKKYIDLGADARLLPFAFDDRILPWCNTSRDEVVNFVGSLSVGHVYRRNSLIHLLKHHVDLKLYIDNISIGHQWLSKPMLREVLQRKDLKGFIDIYYLQRYNLGVRFGLDMYRQMQSAWMTLNFHGDDVPEAGNMRLFEATGLGTCLVTDYKPNLSDYFSFDDEIVVFRNNDELLEKVKYLEKNPSQLLEIGKKAQKRVMENYLWKHRVLLLDKIILSRL